MAWIDEVIDHFLDQTANVATRVLANFQDASFSALHDLIGKHPTLGPILEWFKEDPRDPQRVIRMRDSIARAVAEDRDFSTQFSHLMTAFVHANNSASQIDQRINISGNTSGDIDITAAGQNVIKGSFNRVGDKIKNVYNNPGGKVGIWGAIAMLIAVVVLISLLSSGEDENKGSSGPVAHVEESSAAPPVVPSVPAAPPPTLDVAAGAVLYEPGRGEDVHSSGNIIGIMNQAVDFAPIFSAVDIRSGQKSAGFPVPTEQSGMGSPGTHVRCAFALVDLPSGVNMLLTVDRVQTPSQGTIPASESQSVVARNALTGEMLWTVKSSTFDKPHNPVDKATAGCRLDPASTIYPSNLWISPDRLNALVAFGDDQNKVIDLTSGASRAVPERSVLIGNWIVVPVSKTSDGSYDPRYLDVIDPSTASIVGKINDSSAATFVKQLPSSPDGKILLNTAAQPDDTAYDLPSGNKVWVNDHSKSGALDGLQEATVVVNGPSGETPFGGQRVSAYSAKSGNELWVHDNINGYCGKSGDRAYIVANSQFATINLSDGKQVDFDPSISTCPEVLEGAIVKKTPDGTKIVKA